MKKKLRMAKSKKNKNKGKLNLTVREEQRNKLEQMASLEKRSVSNLIEVMADERWKRLVEQHGHGSVDSANCSARSVSGDSIKRADGFIAKCSGMGLASLQSHPVTQCAVIARRIFDLCRCQITGCIA
jgi:uncharacterized protein (DUF1778 family)